MNSLARKTVSRLMLLLSAMALAGCEDAAVEPAKNQAATAPVTPMPATPIPAAPVPAAPVAANPATAGPAAAPASPASNTETVRADTGVGKKGRGYGGGVVTEPIRQYFRAQQSIDFNIQIPHGMKNFQALHNRNPRDMNEFKREILDPAGIRLPELPDGEKYIYDAKEGELLVERTLPGQPGQ